MSDHQPHDDQKPYVFISHKHDDRALALEVADFLRRITANTVDVHLSSNERFAGPRAGKSLNDELKLALARTDVMLLLYTDESKDWSYCMFEAGVVTDPTDGNPTTLIVIQCDDVGPRILRDDVRVDLRSQESVRTFVKQLCTDPDLIADGRRPLTGFEPTAPELADEADKLRERMLEQRERASVVEARPTTPTMTIRMTQPDASSILAAEGDDARHAATTAIMADEVRLHSAQVMRVFDWHIGPETTLRHLCDDAEPLPPWFQSLCSQVVHSLRGRRSSSVVWAPIDGGGVAYHPVVTSVRRGHDEAPWEFVVAFVRIQPPDLTVRDKMVPLSKIAVLTMTEECLEKPLVELREMEWSRFPVIGEHGQPLMIVHRAEINAFLAERVGEDGVRELQLHHLLEDQERLRLFRTSFATAGPEDPIRELRSMLDVLTQDVLVTEDGSMDTAVLGWITNGMLARMESHKA